MTSRNLIPAPEPIGTDRLLLVALTLDLARHALLGCGGLERRLGASLPGIRVPRDWPLPAFAGILPVLTADLEAVPELARWTRLIVTRKRPTLIGEIGFKSPPGPTGTVDVGYSILPAFRGRGFATEATRAAVGWAIGEPGVERVTADTLLDNLASQRVLAACGFRALEHDADRVAWILEVG